jgi:hypothetical protein
MCVFFLRKIFDNHESMYYLCINKKTLENPARRTDWQKGLIGAVI